MEDLIDVVVIGRCDDQTAARHRAQQVEELGLDGLDVRKDVRVVELEVVQDERSRSVVYKLRAPVEVAGVVVALGSDVDTEPADWLGVDERRRTTPSPRPACEAWSARPPSPSL